MNVLILGKDATLFESGRDVFSDTRKRHQLYARQLCRQAGAGSSIRLVTYTPKAEKYRTQVLEDGLSLHPTRSRGRAFFLFDLIAMLPGLLKDWKPDLVTVQTPWEEGPVGYFVGLVTGAKFLPQLHFDLYAPEWRREYWLNPWRKQVARRVMRGADGVRVVSEVLKQKVADDVGLAAERIHVSPVGVHFHPADRPRGRDPFKAALRPDLVGKPVVLFVGRFHSQKNLGLWLEAARRLLRDLPEARFVMIGDGPELDVVREAVVAMGLAPSFHLPGKLGHERLPEVYAAADLFLLSSDYEGFGRVLVEALMSGVPAVSTACTGPEDLIVDGENGFLTPKGDAEALCRAAKTILMDRALAARMAEAGSVRMRQEFSQEALADKMIKLWMKLADGAARRMPGVNNELAPV